MKASFATSFPFVSAVLVSIALAAPSAPQQKLAKTAVRDRAGLSLASADTNVPAQTLLNPLTADWTKIPSQRIALNRTPPLYDTETPAALDITYVDVRLARAEGKLIVQMIWHDSTPDSAQIAKLPAAPTEGRPHKELTEATDRFLDSAAVMHPQRLPQEGVWPSLQMGDTGQPVTIYFWNSARGSARMQAEGRGTTKRTGESFPCQAAYRNGSWNVAMELDSIPSGMPLAFAIWNGSQQDRDGRKYFTTWLKLE
jgi:hypothetical protein